MQRIKIDVTKIDRTAIHSGAKGKYIDVTLLDNRDGTDQYGNDGMAVQDLGKERREAGEKGPILGNWKYVGQRQAPQQAAPIQHGPSGNRVSPARDDEDFDSIPF